MSRIEDIDVKDVAEDELILTQIITSHTESVGASSVLTPKAVERLPENKQFVNKTSTGAHLDADPENLEYYAEIP
eukprot:UN21585